MKKIILNGRLNEIVIIYQRLGFNFDKVCLKDKRLDINNVMVLSNLPKTYGTYRSYVNQNCLFLEEYRGLVSMDHIVEMQVLDNEK